MLVYGDHSCSLGAADALDRVRRRWRALPDQPPGLVRHSCSVASLIELGAVLQGIADRALHERGEDELSSAQQGLMGELQRLARVARLSWQSGFAEQVCPDPSALDGLDVGNGEVLLRQPEGYAFYAVYPEAYLEAASRLPREAVVIGLRSIGTALAAVVGEASGAAEVLTLRPQGSPFDRRIAASEALAARIQRRTDGWFVVVDEGPGLSGSSFGGAADWLRSLGVSGERIVFMPSHSGEPGSRGSPDHRRRWQATTRLHRSFEQVFLERGDPQSLENWFSDITGKPLHPLVDLSGGKWAEGTVWPVDPGREARKFLLVAENGTFRLKFVGLGEAAESKQARAEALFQAGFGLRPLALRHGFLLEDHVAADPPPRIGVEHLGDYLAFRAERLPATRAGASLAQLVAMASHNLREAGVEPGGVGAWAARAAMDLQPCCRPVHVDARLHRWEWLEVGGRAVKTDALDHARAHDLVGCQDIAWDVAGAIVEHGLGADEARRLKQRVLAERLQGSELVRLMIYCYLGFQIGWWSYSLAASGLARGRWYVATAARWLEGGELSRA